MAAVVEDQPEYAHYEDAYVTVKVTANGFSGQSHCWVAKKAFSNFFKHLKNLDRAHKGTVPLKSMDTDELALKIRAVEKGTRLSVQGSAGNSIDGIWHGVSFGFKFELSQLTVSLSHTGP